MFIAKLMMAILNENYDFDGIRMKPIAKRSHRRAYTHTNSSSIENKICKHYKEQTKYLVN